MLRRLNVRTVVVGVAIAAVSCAAMLAGAYAATRATFSSLLPLQGSAIVAQRTGGTVGGGRINCPDPATTVTLQDDGTDWGARINAADAKLGRNTGTIQINGGGNIATQIVISSCHVLSFGPGRWTNGVRQNAPLNCRSGCETILLKDHTTVQGAEMSQTIIMENNDIPYHYNNPSYTVITTYTERAGNPGQITESYDTILHDFQISGIGIDKHCSNQDGSCGKGGNGTNSVIFLGFLNDGRVQNIKEVQTHAIGLTIGESNMDCPPRCPQHYNYARNVIVTGCEFINVGGGAPIPNNTSGGVSLAIINGLGITIANNVFHDAWGAGFIDIEPNNPADFTKAIKIDHNTMIQDAATGKALFGTYAITIHGIASQEGPYTITNNRIEGAWRNAGADSFSRRAIW